MPKKKIVIWAGSFGQATDYAHLIGLVLKDYIYLCQEDQLRRSEIEKVVQIGSWYYKNLDENWIKDYCKIRNIPIVQDDF